MSFNITAYPTAFSRPNYVSGHSAWMEHIPFAFTIVEALRPRILVELGTHFGDSYCAFCQSADELKLDLRSFAVDTWQGDVHAGFYGEDVLRTLRNAHDERYGRFSNLLQTTFDDAIPYFEEGTIDLLHIDGLHTYDAVKHDFLTWLPLLSDRAVVIFHDTNVREREFGVWKLWDELSAKYPSFAFYHGHGLGVLGVGSNLPASVQTLFNSKEDKAVEIRNFFALSGRLLQQNLDCSNALQFQNNRVAELEAAKQGLDDKLLVTNQALVEQVEQHKDLLVAEQQVTRTLQLQISELNAEKKSLEATSQELEVKVVNAHQHIANIQNSTTWKLGKPVRSIRKNLGTNRQRLDMIVSARRSAGGWLPLFRSVYRVWRVDGLNGIRAAARRSVPAREQSIAAHKNDLLQQVRQKFFNPHLNDLQSETAEASNIKISIIMPVYKIKPELIEEAIQSVLRQSHENWELCIADDFSNDAELSRILRSHVQRDERIKFVELQKNQGISGASNAALALATGDYVALMDNDDLLTWDALESFAVAISLDPEADILYSDEAKVDETGVPVEIFAKPDWSPMLMLNCMYIGHLGVYRRSLVEQIGGFRKEFDFSQDYDLALRASEIARHVLHIPKVLYGWRMIASSAAAGGKPYARETNIAALQSAVERRGWKGKAVALPTANRVVFEFAGEYPLASIIVPSDNQRNIEDTIRSITEDTAGGEFEIIVVTNSKIVSAMQGTALDSRVRFAAYDKPYNFSDKCNAGAAIASGDYLIFFNDDVRIISSGWLEGIMEYLVRDGVGIVGPKLLYENQTIQHAGMVTGVRRLVGTAFHSLPSDTPLHYNFAQSVREVSLICGACLGIKGDVFKKIGGFDAFNAPINHSDVDLCFKVRDLGLTCVYTPHATLLHIGHMSLKEVDKKKAAAPRRKDKADIYLLRRWSSYLHNDPYFTKTMRELLYHDSPEAYEFFAPFSTATIMGGKDALLVSHDLTESGAPRVVLDMARSLKNAGHFVVVASPEDGPMRHELQKIGVPVIIDSLVLTGHQSVEDFAVNFDFVIANTAVTWPAVNQLAPKVDVHWYIHETGLIKQLANLHPDAFPSALKNAKSVIAGSQRAEAVLKDYRGDLSIMEYGVEAYPLDIEASKQSLEDMKRKLVVSVFGSYEPRKGQDLFILGVAALPDELKKRCEFRLHGRILDAGFFEGISNMVKNEPEIVLGKQLSHAEYVSEIAQSDLVVVPSRDDTLPLVSLNALSAGRPLMCTMTTGTVAYLTHGVTGFVISENSPTVITQALMDALANPARLHDVGLAGREVFEARFSQDRFTTSLLALVD
ncbi:glycosyltransferase [Phyllobacterium myrsinacearum]|uniref:GT2 family glycosyltransferase/glycosyltransferase involved in cell wall biosynthesis n=1 Tax=Phyllobacterium myrsinacearum TaxID=28101 RepID=A0A839ET63_9HYPH|nr:glycosyltransferase [Phyllobacterium myrsinacearum]MBA8882129.1 GT2 family glycosyltransferase/glycosyltransferase involved in cell wall biosynthesis [Phyllobacterium myrsinacearum]